MNISRDLVFLLLFMTFLSGCGEDTTGSDAVVLLTDMVPPESDVQTSGDAGPPVDAVAIEEDMSIPELPSRCVPGMAYQPGQGIFRESTDAWGLVAAGVRGTRMSVGDIDGDGFADLIVRRGGRRSDVFSDEPEIARRHHWVLRNQGDRFDDFTIGLDFSQFAETILFPWVAR